MNINKGYQIEQPSVFIPWDIDEKGLQELLDKYGLQRITEGYYCITCVSLEGLHHNMGFHFEIKPATRKIEEFEKFVDSIGTRIKKVGPKVNLQREGKLRELEFFRETYPNLKESYDNFQSHFEKFFGKPLYTKNKYSKFPNHEWQFKDVNISHYVIDRFGQGEHLRIIKGITPAFSRRGLALFRFLSRAFRSRC
ncbi:MAG: hypothetical protein WAV13_02380 [Thermodesulfovibrionales bacterium]